MSKVQRFVILGLMGLVAMAPATQAQMRQMARPYIGFVYPAGGQQGTTFRVKLGGQAMEGLTAVIVSGSGVTARVVQYQRKLNPQDMQLLAQQLADLRKSRSKSGSKKRSSASSGDDMMMMASGPAAGKPAEGTDEATLNMMDRIQTRMREYVLRPASVSLANIAYVEVTIAPDAAPGEREIRLVTFRGGASNPLVFYVGQLPEHSRKALSTAPIQILGKEELARRKRPEDEAEAVAALRFVDGRGRATERYPWNPNGSKGGLTGFTTADGRATILMPHPERGFRSVQLSYRPPELFTGATGPWMRLFRNAYAFVASR